MASHSFYRKWRSQTFVDVVGQTHVTRTLRNALQMARIGHAYLFCGPRGVGKTSVARILAKAINCERPRDGEPCNACPMCIAVTEGRALDVVEIDAASNRRIDEMRDLREKVRFAPSEAKFKVYILDEAHMLTGEASNALLKTLEEPPSHAVFVLVTTEAHKIADTIVSRCQRFNFRRIGSREIVQRLAHVCAGEQLAVAPEALSLIARAATGSLRDAEGLLDQLVAYCGAEISAEQAREILGLTGDEPVRELVAHAFAGRLPEGLALINDVAEGGADLRRFAETLVDFLRGVLLLKGGADAGLLSEAGPELVAAMRACADSVNLEKLVPIIRIFAEAEQGNRGDVAPQLGLEMALVEAILHLSQGRQPGSGTPVDSPPRPEEGAQRSPARAILDRAQAQPSRPTAIKKDAVRETPKVGPRPDEARRTTKPGEVAGEIRGEDGRPQDEAATQQPPATITEASGSTVGLPTIDAVRHRWNEVVDEVGAANKLLQAVLRSTSPYQMREGELIIGCDSAFHRERLGEPAHRRILEKTIADLLGSRVPLRFEVMTRQQRGQAPAPTSDPLVKELLSWGGKIKAVVPGPERVTTGDPPAGESEENDES